MRITKAEIHTGVVALGGALTEIVSLGILHGTAQQIVTSILALGTAAGVWGAHNHNKVINS
jgi:hypothetical protein